MPGYRLNVLIDRPVPEVFDYVATRQVENHPTWEPEVLSIRKVTEGPLRTGSQAVMTRTEFGRERAVPYTITAFEAEQTIAMRSVEKSLTFDIAFHFEAAGPKSTQLRIVVGIVPSGLLRPFGPVMAALFRSNGKRLTQRLKRVVEAAEPRGLPAAELD